MQIKRKLKANKRKENENQNEGGGGEYRKKSNKLKTSSSPESELLATASRTGPHLSITSRHTTQLLTHSGRPMFAQYLSIKQQNVLASISPVKELNQTQFTVNA